MLTALTAGLALIQAKQLAITWNKSVTGYWNVSSDGINVYALSKEGQLRVYSGQNGYLLYDKKLGNEGSAISVLPDGTCYAVADGKLVKLDPRLNQVWSSAQKAQYSKFGSGIAVSSSGTIVVNTLRGLQIFKSDGSSDGLTSMVGIAVGSYDPVFLNENTVVFSGGGLAAITVPDRKQVWGSSVRATDGPVLFNSDMYVVSNETIAKAYVARISIVDGKPVWKTPTTTINRAPAVSRDAVVVPGDLGMWGLAPNDGKVGWRNRLHTFSKALVVGNNLAAVVSRPGGNQVFVCLVDMLTGKVLSSDLVTTGVTSNYEPPFINVGEHAVAGFYLDHIFMARVQ